MIRDEFKTFYLLRKEDVSSTSGTGVVARGVILPSGKCILEWQTFHTSIGIYQNLQDLENIHGHEGKTRIVAGDPPPIGPEPGSPEPPKNRRRRKAKLE